MERFTEATDSHESTTDAIKARVGRFATRAAAIFTSTATIFTGITVGEAITDTDPKAQAASPLDSMNGAEKSWCAWPSRWALCRRVSELATIAAEAAAPLAKDPNTLHNGLPDAFRHCYWSGLMTKEFGWETAKGLVTVMNIMMNSTHLRQR